MNPVTPMRTDAPNLAHLLQETHAGRADYSGEILAGIRAFSHIILHGAGLFGREILEFLETAGVEKKQIAWWDYSYDKPTEIKGITAFPPFTGDFPPEATLVIHCIRNMPPESQAVPQGYFRLDGVLLYECFMCPFMVGGGRVMTLCVKNQRCEAIRCPKLKTGTYTKSNEELGGRSLGYFTFVIGQKCTLSCKHCSQYINHFFRQDRILFPEKQIMKDIDWISAAYDFIRMAVITGGETFLHSDLPSITSHALGKDNFGVVRLQTNGICAISDDMIRILKHERCLLQITDYTEQLVEKQRRLFRANIAKIDAAGIKYYVVKEVWKLPPPLHPLDYGDKEMRKMKADCDSHKVCRMTANGVYYPCNVAMSIHQHRLLERVSDRVIIGECTDIEELRGKIADCDNQQFYESCRYCDLLSGRSIPPGEQGIDARYAHIGIKKVKINVAPNESEQQADFDAQWMLS
jgi:organic radical activating enzyme